MALSTSTNQIKFAPIKQAEATVEKEVENTESNKEKRRRRKQEVAEQQETLVQNPEQNTPDSNGVVQIITAQPAEAPQKIPTPAPVKPVKQEPVCKRKASESEISTALDKLKQKSDDDTKLLILKRRDFTGCLNIEQVGQIAVVFDTQYGRYGAIKFLRNFTSNPEKLSDLDYLFKSNSYKEKLKTLF
jgi:chemotaxis protein histidine kinase CheA